MRSPSEWYQMHAQIAEQFPHLRPAQQRGLTWWVYGTILAGSACQNAVITALLVFGRWASVRQYLGEWLYDGADKAAPCQTQVEVRHCFAPLLGWVVRWWQGRDLALAIDATAHGDRVVALVVSVLYRGTALPVAWHILPAQQAGAWLPPILGLLEQLQPAVPKGWRVLVLADRGLWSPRLWRGLRALRWHPLLRVQKTTTFRPEGGRRQPVTQLVPGPGHAWVGRGVAFKDRPVRRAGTLLVVWQEGQAEPWVLLTDFPPDRVGPCWYGLRVWIELGFRALKGVGWQWQVTRRTDPVRVARHWLVLAVATLWVLAYGTRVEDAEAQNLVPARLRTPPPPSPPRRRPPRPSSLFRRGLQVFRWQLLRGRLWRRLWLTPDLWPEPPADLTVLYHSRPGLSRTTEPSTPSRHRSTPGHSEAA
jgi:hypothetical protein